MSHYELTEQAGEDLLSLAEYIAADNREAAFRLINRILAKCQMLAENPRLGRRGDELLPGLRSHPVGNYLVFYDVTDYGVQVLRIFHGARDLEALFEEEPE